MVILSFYHIGGIRPIVVMGGATARIGDPSGKRVDRPQLSEDVIASNLNSIKDSINDLFDGNTPSDTSWYIVVRVADVDLDLLMRVFIDRSSHHHDVCMFILVNVCMFVCIYVCMQAKYT